MDAHSAQAAEKIRQRANKVHPGTAADKATLLLNISIRVGISIRAKKVHPRTAALIRRLLFIHDYSKSTTTSTTNTTNAGMRLIRQRLY